METNFYPITIDCETFQITRTEYSEEKLKDLREKNNHTHSFFRNGEWIYISNKEGDENLILGDSVNVGTFSDSSITASLIKHIFFRTFKDRFPGIVPIGFYPFRIFSTQQRDDLVYDLLPDNLKGILSYKKQIEVQLRTITIGDRPSFAFVINTHRRWLLNKSCQDLAAEGFNLIGIEVLRSENLPGLTDVLAPNEEFIGVVKSLSGTNAIVETNEGDQTIPLSELSIRKTTYNIHNYLAFATSEERCEQIFQAIDKKKPDLLNPKNERQAIKFMAETLSLKKEDDGSKSPVLYHNKDGFGFTISSEPYAPNNSFQLRTPTFIFDHAATKTNASYPDAGLNDFGPYDSLNFDIKNPNILGICVKDNRGSFSTFLANLIDGLPNSSYFKKGFKKKYDLLDVNCNISEINRYDYDEYDRVISTWDKKPDLVIIEIPEEFKKLDDKENPYYRLKVRLLTLEIPVQFVLNRKMRVPDEYLLNAIALQVYAKLGGTPWVLPSTRSVDREIIIGIGHSIIRKNVYSGAEQNRVVGISTFFSSDGQYLLSNKAKDVPYAEYFDELLKNLQDSFQRLNEQQGWKEGETIRLIFHIFKPIRNVEFDVVSALIRQFPQFKIQFAFVTISKSHPLMIFDPQQPGIKGYNNSVKGEFVAARGTNIILDSSSCLVQMLGAKEIKTGKHGVSRPVLVRVLTPGENYDTTGIEHLLFTDLQYIVQQIFSFTYLSWRGFLPGEIPATMLYSNLISNLLGKLRKIEGWKPDVLNYNLKRKKWFL